MGEKPSKGTFETFDSGSGPVIPEGEKGHMDHMDNGKGGYTKNHADDSQGNVPEVPTKKR